jgi:hypothetical protein
MKKGSRDENPQASLIAGRVEHRRTDMKRLFAFLSTAAICAVVSATPATAQAGGKSSGLHPRTPHLQRHYSNLAQRYGYAPGDAGPSALVPQEETLPAAHCFLDNWVNNGGSHPMYVTMCGP